MGADAATVVAVEKERKRVVKVSLWTMRAGQILDYALSSQISRP